MWKKMKNSRFFAQKTFEKRQKASKKYKKSSFLSQNLQKIVGIERTIVILFYSY